MNPVRVLAVLAVVVSLTPLWLARAAEVRTDSVPVRDNALPDCLDPPSEAEVWAMVKQDLKDCTGRLELKRFSVEKIDSKVEPVKDDPLAGQYQLVHCHYKCTVDFDEIWESDYPIPFRSVEDESRIVYIDRAFLRRDPAADTAPRKDPDIRPSRGDQPPIGLFQLPATPIAKVRFEGNTSIPAEKIKAKVLCKAGEPFDQFKIDDDVKTLMRTHWFTQVEAYYDEVSPGSGRFNLLFEVHEFPRLEHVEFRGRKSIPLQDIEAITGLKKGARATDLRIRNAVRAIEYLYLEKDHVLDGVEFIEGDKPGATRVVIQIHEHLEDAIVRVDFDGCSFATPEMLRSLITPTGQIARDLEATLEQDRKTLVEYYQGLGFFETRVTPLTRADEQPGEIHLTFVINEGPRYTVGKVTIQGNTRIKTDTLMKVMTMRPGQPCTLATRAADRERILARYSDIGCIDTEVNVEPRFASQAGVVNLVYTIHEGEPYLLGELEIRGDDGTKDKEIRREANQAKL